MNCRHRQIPLTLPFVDLGSAPTSDADLIAGDLSAYKTLHLFRDFSPRARRPFAR